MHQLLLGLQLPAWNLPDVLKDKVERRKTSVCVYKNNEYQQVLKVRKQLCTNMCLCVLIVSDWSLSGLGRDIVIENCVYMYMLFNAFLPLYLQGPGGKGAPQENLASTL